MQGMEVEDMSWNVGVLVESDKGFWWRNGGMRNDVGMESRLCVKV